MIVSEKFKYVWVSVPKAGTHSMSHVLKKYYNGSSVNPHDSHHMIIPPNYLGHYLFTNCRCPYSRAVSTWYYFVYHSATYKRESWSKSPDPDNFTITLQWALENYLNPAMQRQVDRIGAYKYDLIIPIENVEEAFKKLPFYTGQPKLFPCIKSTRLINPRRKSYVEYLTPESVALIDAYYSLDFERFGYKKGAFV